MSCRLAGCLTSPCNSANLGVGVILEGQLFAYGVGSNINIVDLFAFKILCTLQGGHGRIPVTAVAWDPDCHLRDLRLTSLRCVSGDGEGHIVVWDVSRLSVLFKLTDPKRSFENSEGVRALAWVMNKPSLLAVVLGPSTLVLWEAKANGAPLWHRDLAGVGSLHSLCVDPLDRRSVCLCGSHGVCLLVCFTTPYDKTTVKQYRVSSSSPSSQKIASNLHCLFPHTENTLLVMLSDEILVFDVEFGQPLSTIVLPNGLKPFKKLLGVYGDSISYGNGLGGGMDTIYALHEDGVLSIWNRISENLSYSLQLESRLIPKPLRGMHGSQLYIMISCGSFWWDPNTQTCKFPEKRFQILNVMSNGQIWKWNLSLPSHPCTTQKPNTPPSPQLPDLINFDEDSPNTDQSIDDQTNEHETNSVAPSPRLDRVLCTLSGSVNKISVLPVCLMIPSDTSRVQMPLIAAPTTSGSLDLVTLQKGGVQWLGSGPLAVSFTSEKLESLWRNTILLTDLRYGESTPFRDTAPESTNMLGIRTAPSGKYILVLLKDAPSEVWMVTGLKDIKRIFHVESQFTAVEWALPTPDVSPEHQSTVWGSTDGIDLPIETLIFTVNEGRVESISFQGKKIIERKVRVPGWANFGPAGSGNRCISIAAVGSLVLLGDYDGNLIKWDMESGKTESISTDAGPVRRIFLNTYLHNGLTHVRVAILSATWKCNVPSRFMDVAWMPSLSPSRVATLLAAVTEEGNIIITEVNLPTIVSKQSTQSLSTHLDQSMKELCLMEDGIDALSTNSSVFSTLILPKSLSLFIRLMIQVGVPMSVLEEIVMESGKGSLDESALEDQIWSKLPIDMQEGTGVAGLSPRHMPSSSVPFSEETDGSQTDQFTGERGLNEVKRRTRRRSPFPEVSHGMSLASEVLKSIEAQNMRSRGFLGRVKGSIARKSRAEEHSLSIASTVVSNTADCLENSLNSAEVGSLCELLKLLALLRCEGQLLLPSEWKAYRSALEDNSIIPRMAVAAIVSGDNREVEFWKNLTSTLKSLQESVDPSTPVVSRATPEAPLWDQQSTVLAAQARAKMHDTIPRTHIESHPELQEKRLLEYVSLGDYNTAVGFLLSSAPEASVRYYRDSLCALALASVGSVDGSNGLTPQSGNSPINVFAGQGSRSSLHLQVAKVVSAHAASVGDSLLGVPLLCAAGLHHEAVCLLQDASLWSYGSVLIASMLDGPHHAIACLRLGQHVLRDEGDIWRSVGILTTGGCLREAAQVLLDAGYIDCAAAYCEACKEFGLVMSSEGDDGRLFSALPSAQLVRVASTKTSKTPSLTPDDECEKYSISGISKRFREYITSIVIGL
eukprot:g4828.t1